MDKKLTIKLVITFGLLVILSACTMRASRAPVLKTTPAPEIPFAVSSGQMVAEAVTETAAAANGTGGNPDGSVSSDSEEEPTKESHIPPTYSLQKGEWPMCIARRYDLDPTAMLNLSGLSFESKPDVGFVLKLPQNTTWPSKFGARALREHPVDRTVVAGETIYTIACSYGDVDPSSIVSENNLEAPFKLSGGQVLHIP